MTPAHSLRRKIVGNTAPKPDEGEGRRGRPCISVSWYGCAHLDKPFNSFAALESRSIADTFRTSLFKFSGLAPLLSAAVMSGSAGQTQ